MRAGEVQTSGSAETHKPSSAFVLNLPDALMPDPGSEDMFKTRGNKFAFSPGQLSKMLNPKSHNALYALGGLEGLEKGLRTDRNTGLSVNETTFNDTIAFEVVSMNGVTEYSSVGGVIADANSSTGVAIVKPDSKAGGFIDRKRIFSDNRLPEKKNKTLIQLTWQTYNDKVLILLTIAAVVSLALGLYQTFGGSHREGEPRVEWVEGVAILVAIIIVVAVGTLNDCKLSRCHLYFAEDNFFSRSFLAS